MRIQSDESLIGAMAKKPKRKPFQEVETDVDPFSTDGIDIPLELEECLDDLIKHAPKKSLGSVAQIAFLLSDMYPNLPAPKTECFSFLSEPLSPEVGGDFPTGYLESFVV